MVGPPLTRIIHGHKQRKCALPNLHLFFLSVGLPRRYALGMNTAAENYLAISRILTLDFSLLPFHHPKYPYLTWADVRLSDSYILCHSFLSYRLCWSFYPTIYSAFGSLTRLPCNTLRSSTMGKPGLHVIYDSASSDLPHVAELEYMLKSP